MKAAREHRVPLSEAALAILRERSAPARSSDHVFPGLRADSALSNTALLMTLKRIGYDAVTTHGFRSSFRDWAAERTDFPSEVAEAALAHTIGNQVEAAYRRGDLFDKRRQLMEAWVRHCAPVLALSRNS
jgi:integrase